MIKLLKTGSYYDRRSLAVEPVAFFYVLFRSTDRLTVFFDNSAIKLFTDVGAATSVAIAKNKLYLLYLVNCNY